jgi:hypothetical protein
MNSSYHDFDRAYVEGVYAFVTLVKHTGAAELIKDLKAFFPETLCELTKAIDNEAKNKQLARLLDANQMRCGFPLKSEE